MYVTIITNDYNNILYSHYTDYDNLTSGNDNMTLTNWTNNENKIDILIPSLPLTIPCGLSFLCLMSLMVYMLSKPLLNNK